MHNQFFIKLTISSDTNFNKTPWLRLEINDIITMYEGKLFDHSGDSWVYMFSNSTNTSKAVRSINSAAANSGSKIRAREIDIKELF